MSNHERIHIAQATELLVVPFYALWLGDFAYGMIRHKGDAKEAYRHIRLEQEAFDHEADPTYLEKRPCFAWRAYPRAEVAERWKASQKPLTRTVVIARWSIGFRRAISPKNDLLPRVVITG